MLFFAFPKSFHFSYFRFLWVISNCSVPYWIFVCLSVKHNTQKHWVSMLLVHNHIACVFFPPHSVLFPLFPFVSGNTPTYPEIPELLAVFKMVHKEIYMCIYVYCQQYVGVHFPIILVGNCNSIITYFSPLSLHCSKNLLSLSVYAKVSTAIFKSYVMAHWSFISSLYSYAS